MPLTLEQKQLIRRMDYQAKEILRYGGEEALLMSLCDKMNAIKQIMKANSSQELNAYCEQYEGFYHYMHLLERLAIGTANGLFDDIIK